MGPTCPRANDSDQERLDLDEVDEIFVSNSPTLPTLSQSGTASSWPIADSSHVYQVPANSPMSTNSVRSSVKSAADVLTQYLERVLDASNEARSSGSTTVSSSTNSFSEEAISTNSTLSSVIMLDELMEDATVTPQPSCSGWTTASPNSGFEQRTAPSAQMALSLVQNLSHTACIWTPDGAIEWTSTDNQRMNELCHHSLHMLGQCDPTHRVNEQEFGAQDMTIVLDVLSRQMIEMCKNLTPFRQLDDNTQMKLIKDNITSMCALRGVLNYDHALQAFRPTHLADGWFVKFDKITHMPFYNIWRWFYPKFDASIANDRPLMLLLMAVTLFDNEGTHGDNAPAVRQCRSIYERMLKGYMLARIGSTTSATHVYNTLMMYMKRLRKLNDDAARFLLEQSATGHSNTIDPLLVELYDLRPLPLSAASMPTSNG